MGEYSSASRGFNAATEELCIYMFVSILLSDGKEENCFLLWWIIYFFYTDFESVMYFYLFINSVEIWYNFIKVIIYLFFLFFKVENYFNFDIFIVI